MVIETESLYITWLAGTNCTRHYSTYFSTESFSDYNRISYLRRLSPANLSHCYIPKVLMTKVTMRFDQETGQASTPSLLLRYALVKASAAVMQRCDDEWSIPSTPYITWQGDSSVELISRLVSRQPLQNVYSRQNPRAGTFERKKQICKLRFFETNWLEAIGGFKGRA